MLAAISNAPVYRCLVLPETLGEDTATVLLRIRYGNETVSMSNTTFRSVGVGSISICPPEEKATKAVAIVLI